MATPARSAGHTPIHVGYVRTDFVSFSTANTNRDGTTGSYQLIFSAGDAGSRVSRIDFKATGTTTAGMLRIFINEGASRKLIGEVAVSAITPSSTVATWSGEWVPSGVDGRILTKDQSLYFTTHNAEEFVALVTAGDY